MRQGFARRSPPPCGDPGGGNHLESLAQWQRQVVQDLVNANAAHRADGQRAQERVGILHILPAFKDAAQCAPASDVASYGRGTVSTMACDENQACLAGRVRAP